MTIMKNNSTIRFLLSYYILLGIHLISFGQNLDDEIKSKLSVLERKKIEKADEQFNKGIKSEEEANKIIIMEPASASNDKLSIRKKYTSQRLNTAEYYYNSNNLKIEVYQSEIKKFWKKYSGDKFPLKYNHEVELMANDSIRKATDLRFDAKKTINPFEKLDLIIQAETIEKKFIPVLGKILFSYLSYPIQYGQNWLISTNTAIPGATREAIPEVKPEVKVSDQTINDTLVKPKIQKNQMQSNDSSLYGKIAVSEEQIDAFNNFLKKKYPAKYENYIINFQALDYMDVKSLREAWYKYLYGPWYEDSVLIANESDSNRTGPDSLTTTAVEQTNIPVSKRVENESYDHAISDTSEFIFRVQIVACRVPLDENTLKGIYYGPEKIFELHEDNWYKYAITKFPTYRLARKIRDSLTVPGAFVIAYLHGKRIKITPAIAYKHRVKLPTNLISDQIVYRLQIVASKVELSENILHNIYSGNLSIDKIYEDGWYKYSLFCGNKYKEAIKLLKSVAIPGAFIVAYYHNKKINVDPIAN